MYQYKVRITDEILKEKLAGKGAVLIEGPKWCGKTTSAKQIAGSTVYMDDPRNRKQNMTLAETEPEILLRGNTPRLIDEWQLAPRLWDSIRFEVDRRQAFGQFILTGSSVPADMSEVSHTGTGRIARLKMRPMSLYESGEANGTVSLSALFEKDGTVCGSSSLTLDDVAFLVCRGGWPMATYLTEKLALNQAFDYYESVVGSDISRADKVTRDPEKAKRILRSLDRNQGSQIGEDTIVADISVNEEEGTSRTTVHSYIEALKKIFVIEDLPAWNPNLRSKTAIRTSDTRYFVDPSIAAAALGFGPGDLIGDLNTFGFMFETLAIRDLRVYSQALGGGVYRYRDKNGLECDAVVHLPNGKYGLIEIKLGGDKLIDDGCKALLRLSEMIDTDKMKKPSFLMVLTANGELAYRNKEGVLIVPIGALGA